MADAWTILIDNSSLSSGDAWEHLLNQEGGSCDVRYVANSAISFDTTVRSITFNTQPIVEGFCAEVR